MKGLQELKVDGPTMGTTSKSDKFSAPHRKKNHHVSANPNPPRSEYGLYTLNNSLRSVTIPDFDMHLIRRMAIKSRRPLFSTTTAHVRYAGG